MAMNLLESEIKEMEQTKVYLAGPINGCTDDECITWRESLKSQYPFDFADPMKRDYRGKEEESFREIVELDKIDIRNCDAMIAMFVKPSVGTSMEIYFAHSLDIPVILIDQSDKPLSPWLKYHSSWVVKNPDSAVIQVQVALNSQLAKRRNCLAYDPAIDGKLQ